MYFKTVSLDTIDPIKKVRELNRFLNKFDYGFVSLQRIRVKSPNGDQWSQYRTENPMVFEQYKIGTCWDFAEYEASWFKKNMKNFSFTNSKGLKNYQWSLYYNVRQKQNSNSQVSTHTWLAFGYDNKVYTIESAWGSHMGIKVHDNEISMIQWYQNNLIGKNISQYNYYTCKYSMINKYGLTPQEYMNHMNKKGNIIYIKGWSLSDIK